MKALLVAAIIVLAPVTLSADTLQEDVRNSIPDSYELVVPQAKVLLEWAEKHPEHWLIADELSEEVRGKTLKEAGHIVNARVNALISYRSDGTPYSTKPADIWSSPKEATGLDGKLSGDCEEFAMLKIVILWKAGFSADSFGFAYFGYSGGTPNHAAAYVDLTGRLEDRLILSNDVEPATFFAFIKSFGYDFAFVLYSSGSGGEGVCDVINNKLDCVAL